MKLKSTAAGLSIAAALGIASTANASISLSFLGLQDQEPILNYYDGGFGGLGSGPGPNYGITFEANSLAVISEDNGGSGDFSGAPYNTIAFFLVGPGDIMNKASGFTTGFSFFYSSPFAPGTVTVWSGLNATGTELADLNLAPTPQGGPGCDRDYCPWVPFGVTFAGTAESVEFTGSADRIGFSAVTLGSSTPLFPKLRLGQ